MQDCGARRDKPRRKGMAMERIKVTFPTDRLVYINGEKAGRTNEVLRIAAGIHIFDLGSYANYEPGFHLIDVEGTSVLRPLVIAFTRRQG